MTRVRIHNKAWVLIGDGRKALILHNEGDADLLDLRRTSVRVEDNPPTREQGTDAPGRAFGAGGIHSAVETTDWHEIEAQRFAASMAAEINEAVRTGACKEIVLVARLYGTRQQEIVQAMEAARIMGRSITATILVESGGHG